MKLFLGFRNDNDSKIENKNKKMNDVCPNPRFVYIFVNLET